MDKEIKSTMRMIDISITEIKLDKYGVVESNETIVDFRDELSLSSIDIVINKLEETKKAIRIGNLLK